MRRQMLFSTGISHTALALVTPLRDMIRRAARTPPQPRRSFPFIRWLTTHHTRLNIFIFIVKPKVCVRSGSRHYSDLIVKNDAGMGLVKRACFGEEQVRGTPRLRLTPAEGQVIVGVGTVSERVPTLDPKCIRRARVVVGTRTCRHRIVTKQRN